MYYLNLGLDLKNHIPSTQRDQFYSELKKGGWEKIPGITTTWEREMDWPFPDNERMEMARQEVETCARASRIESINFTLEAFDYRWVVRSLFEGR